MQTLRGPGRLHWFDPGGSPLRLRFGRWARLVAVAAAATALVLGASACGDDEGASGDPAPATGADTPSGQVDEEGAADEVAPGGGGERDEGDGDAQDPASVPVATAGSALRIDSAQARALLQANPQALVIDVRNVEDYIDGHVVGAQNIDVQNEGLWQRRTDALDKDRATVVYCRTGELSAQAAQKLVDMGFTEVYDLGGMADWTEGDLPVDR